MTLDITMILPKDPSSYKGHKSIRIVTAFFLLVVLVRSCIHLFASDGGAKSIAGIDISVAGGENIIAIFHQWGAIQLILAALLLLLFFRYPGFTPLIVLTLAIDPIMRAISGQIAPLTSEGTPPGEALNWPAFFTLVLLFVASLKEESLTKKK
jgi:membrane protease YdiL (CAAX protease family)